MTAKAANISKQTLFRVHKRDPKNRVIKLKQTSKQN